MNKWDLLFCVSVSISVKAVTGMRVRKQKWGYVTFMTLALPHSMRSLSRQPA
jgi:hypothetical protein